MPVTAQPTNRPMQPRSNTSIKMASLMQSTAFVAPGRLGTGSSRRQLCSTVLAHGAGPHMRRAGVLQTTQQAAPAPAAAPRPTSSTTTGRTCRVVARAEPEQERQVIYNKEFGYSRKDVLLIIVGLIGLGVVMYEGLQAAGMSPGMAGNWVQLTIFMGICVGWVSTYLWRVANKKMTYAQQLQMYEEAVMQKRLEEMTEAELEQLLTEVETDKQKLTAARAALEKQQQQRRSSAP